MSPIFRKKKHRKDREPPNPKLYLTNKQRRGGRSVDNGVPTALMQFVQPNAVPFEDPDWIDGSNGIEQITGGLFIKGNRWEVYKDAVLARGGKASEITETTVSNYQKIYFSGYSNIIFCSLFKYCFLGHAPPQWYIQEIKRISTVGTKVGIYFANFESIAHTNLRDPLWLALETLSKSYLYNSSIAQDNNPGGNPNVGCVNIDIDEKTYGPPNAPAPCGTTDFTNRNGVHTWICDLFTQLNEYTSSWLDELQGQVVARYGNALLDYIIVDNTRDDPFYGTSSNEDATATNATTYNNGWRTLCAQADLVLPPAASGLRLVNNSAMVSTKYTNLQVPRRYGEHFFHDEQLVGNETSEDKATILSRLNSCRGLQFFMPGHQVKNGGVIYTNRSYSASSVDNWTGTPNGPGGNFGTWDDVAGFIQSNGLKEVCVPLAGRDGQFALHWQDQFLDPRK